MKCIHHTTGNGKQFMDCTGTNLTFTMYLLFCVLFRIRHDKLVPVSSDFSGHVLYKLQYYFLLKSQFKDNRVPGGWISHEWIMINVVRCTSHVTVMISQGLLC